MGLEKNRTVKPSLLKIGEGRWDWAKVNPVTSGRDLNDGLSNQRHGGASADDMVILCRTGCGPALYQRLKAYLERRGLKLNDAKRRCVQAEEEGFKFPWFEITWPRQRFRTWLWRKYDRTLVRYTFFTDERLHGQYQLWPLPKTAGWTRSPCGGLTSESRMRENRPSGSMRGGLCLLPYIRVRDHCPSGLGHGAFAGWRLKIEHWKAPIWNRLWSGRVHRLSTRSADLHQNRGACFFVVTGLRSGSRLGLRCRRSPASCC